MFRRKLLRRKGTLAGGGSVATIYAPKFGGAQTQGLISQGSAVTRAGTNAAREDTCSYLAYNGQPGISLYAESTVRIIATDQAGTTSKYIDSVLGAGVYTMNTALLGDPGVGLTNPGYSIWISEQKYIAPLPAQVTAQPATATRPGYNTGTGFFVAAGSNAIYDPSGKEFRPRGVNINHYDIDSVASITQSNANTARMFVAHKAETFGGRTKPELDAGTLAMANLLMATGMAFMPVAIDPQLGTDTTGGTNPLQLPQTVADWVANKALWQGLNGPWILNICNEWGPVTVDWRDRYITAVQTLRTEGYTQLIVIDCPGYGQDETMAAAYGQAIFDADPQKNLAFSYHCYGGTAGSGGLTPKLQAMRAAMPNVPIMVGEFGPGRAVGSSPSWMMPVEIPQVCDRLNMGWMAWAWDDGAGSNADTSFNPPASERGFRLPYNIFTAYTGQASQLTVFGQQVVKSPGFGLEAAAVKYTPAVSGLRWSNAASWGGTLPTAGDAVVIPSGQTYILDTTSAVAQSVSVAGKLQVDPAVDVALVANFITVEATGELVIGTAASRYTRTATITLNGALASSPSSNRYVPDETARTGAGNGRLARLFGGTGAAAEETFTVTFTSATAFTVSGSVSGALGSGNTGTLFNNKVRFIATPGATPWAAGHTVTVTMSRRASVNAGVQRGLRVMPGGKLRLHGVVKTGRTKLNAHAAAGASSFTLDAAPSGWAANDEIVIAGSDFRQVAEGQSQKLVAQSIAGTALATTSTISAGRWGRLQYATNAGPSLTADTLTKDAATDQTAWDATPKVIDERAPVLNLTRNIVIQGANDTDWNTSGFGAHIMAMGNTSVIQVDGVEIRRGGQRGALGRYPFHWHLSSYNAPDGMTLPSDGTFLGSCSGQYLRNCSINGSSNRAVTVHATHGVDVSDNMAYDIRGHAYFFEEGSEEDCTMRRNVACKVRTVASDSDCLVGSDSPGGLGGQQGGAAGFWLSNAKNTWEDNWALECDHWGVLNGFGMLNCIGQSQEVAIVPFNNRPVLHRSFTIMGCCIPLTGFTTSAGMATTFPHTNNRGDHADRSHNFPGVENLMQLSDHQIMKNRARGYFNRVRFVKYAGWVQADNENIDFVGQVGDDTNISTGESILFCGTSLNVGSIGASVASASSRRAGASYHELLKFQHCIAMNYPSIAPKFNPDDGERQKAGGFISLDDLYTSAQFTFTNFVGNKMINSAWGTRILPPHLDGSPLNNRNWTYAGAIIDVNNFAGAGAGRTWIYNVPFLTYGLGDLVDVAPAGFNGKSTASRFMGFLPHSSAENSLASPSAFTSRIPMEMYQLDPANNSDQGSWILGNANLGTYNFHHASVRRGGRYRIVFPGSTINWFAGKISYGHDAADNVLVAIQYNNGAPTTVYETSAFSGSFYSLTSPPQDPQAGDISAGYTRVMTAATSIAEVAASNGDKYFYESAQSRVWIKHVGGLTAPGIWVGQAIGQFEKLYHLCIK
jgi:G8 domain/Cellulase (glycosyl hydrolase family 5)